MSTLIWILGSGILMSAIALVGSVTLFIQEATLKKLLLPLVALAAGTLLGGALFHMIPASVDKLGNRLSIYVWILLGFAIFLGLEQFLHWHHCHRAPSEHRPLTYLIEIKHEENAGLNVVHFLSFLFGLALPLAVRFIFED